MKKRKKLELMKPTLMKLSKLERLVMRNNVGKVQLNFGISKGMPFEKVPRKNNKGVVCCFAVLEAGKAPVSLVFMVTKNDLDPLHSKLEEMAS